MVFSVSGKGSNQLFESETGGHRWQRIPPNEKRGRVHTSTITVAVLPIDTYSSVKINYDELDIQTCRGSGAGGQHRNKTETAVVITHIPTGLVVRCENERSQHQNKAQAIETLQARLLELQRSKDKNSRDALRKDQVGSGQRGDKTFTIAVQRDQVTNHYTGKSTTYKRYSRGHFEDLE